MNITTISINRDEAAAKLREYEAVPAEQRSDADQLLLHAYRAAAQGSRIVNLHAAFRETGLNERGQPRLAVARANWSECVFHSRLVIQHGIRSGAGSFTATRRVDPRLRVNCVTLPAGTFDNQRLTLERLWSPVPHIPPHIRPRALAQHHILFEVEAWQTYPVDPFLIRRFAGPFFEVVAEWELTPLEASLLSALAV